MTQIYEEYWRLTLEYSDIDSSKFIGTLKIIVDFINTEDTDIYTSDLYKKLQENISNKFQKSDMGSVRKSINQFVKLGFVNFELQSYHLDVLNFLNANSSRERKSLFSKIVYSNASFNKSVTKNSETKEINFLLRTLEEAGRLSKQEIIGLMMVNISDYSQGFLTKEEVLQVKKQAEEKNFIDRKYNQVNYLWTLLKKLDDLDIVGNYLYFKEDIEIEKINSKTKKRDNYLHRIYKNQLKNEVYEELNSEQCMVEKLRYPSLIASHIKPFIQSDKEEEYDVDNGLLLSRNMDILFDKGWISFEDNGDIIISRGLPNDVIDSLSLYTLDSRFINNNRKRYLEFHRNHFNSKLTLSL
jgi:hypothetical protein